MIASELQAIFEKEKQKYPNLDEEHVNVKISYQIVDALRSGSDSQEFFQKDGIAVLNDVLNSACLHEDIDIVNALFNTPTSLKPDSLEQDTFQKLGKVGNINLLKTLLTNLKISETRMDALVSQCSGFEHLEIFQYLMESPKLKNEALNSFRKKFCLWEVFRGDNQKLKDYVLYDLNFPVTEKDKERMRRIYDSLIGEHDYTEKQLKEMFSNFSNQVDKRDLLVKASKDNELVNVVTDVIINARLKPKI